MKMNIMFVYVKNKDSMPLMSCHPAKARILLKKGKAKVVDRTPFTIQLLYQAENNVSSVNVCFISGKRSNGNLQLKLFDGTAISQGVSGRKLKLLEPVKVG